MVRRYGSEVWFGHGSQVWFGGMVQTTRTSSPYKKLDPWNKERPRKESRTPRYGILRKHFNCLSPSKFYPGQAAFCSEMNCPATTVHDVARHKTGTTDFLKLVVPLPPSDRLTPRLTMCTRNQTTWNGQCLQPFICPNSLAELHAAQKV